MIVKGKKGVEGEGRGVIRSRQVKDGEKGKRRGREKQEGLRERCDRERQERDGGKGKKGDRTKASEGWRKREENVVGRGKRD